ncbi:hypothetical protein [Halococcus agarilyticus]|uniref:hypothetical protein n=1 Tax=Halococcus agarilyticus TaxID=1232219 RepID=UPI0006780176|nr:hypothetical protein [Halococcus agarilyticus]
MSGKRPVTGRRAFLVLGASAVLAGCTQTSSGGNSSTTTAMRDEEPTSSSSAPTAMRDEEPTSSSPASTTTPDRTSTRSPQPTATSNVTTPNATPTRETEREGTDGGFVEIRSNDSFPQTTVRVTGSDPSTDGSATILVWNDAETARRIRVAVANRNAGTSPLQKTYRIEADAYVEITVTKSGAYTLDVGVDGDEPATIDFPVDTCNSRRINVAIGRDGTVDLAWLSTAVGCPTVTTTG